MLPARLCCTCRRGQGNAGRYILICQDPFQHDTPGGGHPTASADIFGMNDSFKAEPAPSRQFLQQHLGHMGGGTKKTRGKGDVHPRTQTFLGNLLIYPISQRGTDGVITECEGNHVMRVCVCVCACVREGGGERLCKAHGPKAPCLPSSALFPLPVTIPKTESPCKAYLQRILCANG